MSVMTLQWTLLRRVLFCTILFERERERDGYEFEDSLTVTGLEDVSDVQSVQGGWGLTANNVRNKVADYFVTCWSCSLANVKNMNSRVHTVKKRQGCMNFSYLCSINYGNTHQQCFS